MGAGSLKPWSGHYFSTSTDLELPRSRSDGCAGDDNKVKEKGSPPPVQASKLLFQCAQERERERKRRGEKRLRVQQTEGEEGAMGVVKVYLCVYNWLLFAGW